MSQSTLLSAGRMFGDHLRNVAGEDLGRIEDLIIDSTTGQISYAIVSSSGVSAGERLRPIPWSALRSSMEGDYLVFDGDRAVLEGAPYFERRNWADMNDPAWRDRVSAYYPHSAYRPAERVVVERDVPRRGSVIGAALTVVLLVFLLGFTYLVATRGWESAKNTVVGWVQGVSYAAKETSEDAALTTKVKTALTLSRRVPATDINVDTQNEIVTLRGEVPDPQTRDLAEMIARDTEGVSQVHNELTVRGESASSGGEIQRLQNRVNDLETRYQIHDALTKDSMFVGSNVEVQVMDGTVTLTGSVQTPDQKNRAQQIASQLAGVRSVNNLLQVSGTP